MEVNRAMEVTEGCIYDYPKYYDLIFGSDWKAEFNFLEYCFEHHAKGEVKNLFEPACGTGRLLFRFARAGYEVSGLDLNSKAIDFCNERLTRHGFDPTAVVGDMTDYRVPKKVDASFNTINSFRHLCTEKLAHNHLRCVADSLRKGGIYVLGLHLTPSVGEACEEESWSARRGNLQVNTRMWLLGRDEPNRTETYGMQYEIYTPTKFQTIRDEILFRTYTATEIKELIGSIATLEIAAVFDFCYDTQRPIEIDDSSEDIVLVLRKK